MPSRSTDSSRHSRSHLLPPPHTASHRLKSALKINPGSSPLYCYLGMAMHANGKPAEALRMLSRATEIDGKNVKLLQEFLVMLGFKES